METNGGKYLKKDFFVHKNMKRKFLEILFFTSELGGKPSLERLKILSWRFFRASAEKVRSMKLMRKTFIVGH
jgi:hypothetical protein